MEKSNDSSFVFLATFSSHTHRREGAPEDGFTHIDRNEQIDSTSQSIAIVHHFIQQNSHVGSEDQLDDDQTGIQESELFDVSIHSSPDISNGFQESNDDSGQILEFLIKSLIIFIFHVEFEDFDSIQQLDDHSTGHNGRDSQFHQTSSV